MPCVETFTPWLRGLAASALCLLLASCGLFTPSSSPTSPDAGAPAAKPGAPVGPTGQGGASAVPRKPGALVKLPAPQSPRSWADARLQAARRLMAANPDQVYTSTPPDILLAIPVLSIELNADGSVRHITVLRYPSQARDTVDMAMQAIYRAAPFGDVSRLPKPWKFNETFLFDDARRFKPMTLDQR